MPDIYFFMHETVIVSRCFAQTSKLGHCRTLNLPAGKASHSVSWNRREKTSLKMVKICPPKSWTYCTSILWLCCGVAAASAPTASWVSVKSRLSINSATNFGSEEADVIEFGPDRSGEGGGSVIKARNTMMGSMEIVVPIWQCAYDLPVSSLM